MTGALGGLINTIHPLGTFKYDRQILYLLWDTFMDYVCVVFSRIYNEEVTYIL